jgi:hypothetical protein
MNNLIDYSLILKRKYVDRIIYELVDTVVDTVAYTVYDKKRKLFIIWFLNPLILLYSKLIFY